MKRIGILGGMSWESTTEYYRLLNQGVRDRVGGLASADLVLRSVDFAPIEERMSAGRWEEIGAVLAAEARTLAGAGAELLLLATNTMHKVAHAITAAVDVPLLHIFDPTAEAVRAAGLSTVGLLATGYTMEDPYFAGYLRDRHGLATLVPGPEDRKCVHDVIFDELCRGRVTERARADYRRVLAELAGRGAQGVLLACTEIGLLVGAEDSPVPLFDTTKLHVARALDLAFA